MFHYYGFREYEPALTEFQRALELQPNYSLALQFIAFVHRRQGKWDRTCGRAEKIHRSGPGRCICPGRPCRDVYLSAHVERSEDLAQHALTIDPHEATAMRMLLLSSLNRTGNAQEPLRLLASFPPDDLLLPNTGMFDMVIGSRGETFVLARDFNAALKAWEVGAVATTNEWQRFAAKAGIHVHGRRRCRRTSRCRKSP